MTKSEIFKAAHALAKATLEVVGDYMVALTLALKSVYKNMVNSNTVKIVETYRGLRKVDVTNKLVENNEGEMVTFTNVIMRAIDGVQHAMYVHANGGTATALTLSGHKKANELSSEQKAKNSTRQRVQQLNNEQYIR